MQLNKEQYTKLLKVIIASGREEVRGKYNFEKLGNKIQQVSRELVEEYLGKKGKAGKSLPYKEKCDLESNLRKECESIYESFFCNSTGKMYDWINGNENWKGLIEKLEDKKNTTKKIIDQMYEEYK